MIIVDVALVDWPHICQGKQAQQHTHMAGLDFVFEKCPQQAGREGHKDQGAQSIVPQQRLTVGMQGCCQPLGKPRVHGRFKREKGPREQGKEQGKASGNPQSIGQGFLFLFRSALTRDPFLQRQNTQKRNGQFRDDQNHRNHPEFVVQGEIVDKPFRKKQKIAAPSQQHGK